MGEFTNVSKCAAHGAVPSSFIFIDLFIAFITAHVTNTFWVKLLILTTRETALLQILKILHPDSSPGKDK